MKPRPTVFILDDDSAVRSAIALLVTSCGWEARPYGSARAFLDGVTVDGPTCLVLDLQMPEMNGPDVQAVLATRGTEIPVIVVSAYPDHPLADQARAAGALAVLAKPFSDDELLGLIESSVSG